MRIGLFLNLLVSSAMTSKIDEPKVAVIVTDPYLNPQSTTDGAAPKIICSELI